MAQHLKPKCVNVQTPMGWHGFPQWRSHPCLPAHVHINTRTYTHAHRSIGNNGGITHLKCEWLYYLAITFHLPWNTVLRNWAFTVHKKETTINLSLKWGLWSAWNFILKWDTHSRRGGRGSQTCTELILNYCGCTCKSLVPTRNWRGNNDQKRKGWLNKQRSQQKTANKKVPIKDQHYLNILNTWE